MSKNLIIVVGTQWGDEGKGKMVDVLSEDREVAVRYQGGANAGHTIEVGDIKWIFHLIPSAILRDDVVCILGNGMVVDPHILLKEIKQLHDAGIYTSERIGVSSQAMIITPWGKKLEQVRSNHVGSTNQGIGPTYEQKMRRVNPRFSDVQQSFDYFIDRLKFSAQEISKEVQTSDEEIESFGKEIYYQFRHLVMDSVTTIRKAVTEGKKIIIEGAQGVMLDVDHGTYPFVTSSSTIPAGAFTGTGLPIQTPTTVIGISKAYTTRVGEGPFPTELFGDEAEKLRTKGAEFGATTGRPRRPGWLDLFQLQYSVGFGIDELVITKVDVLTGYDEIKLCVGYDGYNYYPKNADLLAKVVPKYISMPGWSSVYADGSSLQLHPNLLSYIGFIQDYLKIPVSMISIGPERSQIIKLK